MLSRVAISRALAMRGVSTSAIKKDYMYFPGYMMSVSQHKEFLEHPNRNPDNYESYLIPFPQAPKFADKDPELNALREKAMGDWGALSIEETNALYDGHFKYRYYRYQQPTDRWKFYAGIVFLNLGLASLMLRVFFAMEGHSHPEYYSDHALYDGHFKYRYYRYQQPTDRWKFYAGIVFLNLGLASLMLRVFFAMEGHSHPEYYSDPHFLTEYVKRGLQSNFGHLRGLSTHWNYQKGEWNDDKPFYYWFFPYFQSPRETGQLGFSKWQKE